MKLKFMCKINFFLKILCAGYLSLLIYACIPFGVSPPATYPNELPTTRQISENGCPDISGQYTHVGELYYYDSLYRKWVSLKSRNEQSLDFLLLNSQETSTPASMITIRQNPNDSIEVFSVDDNKAVLHTKQLSLANRDYSCSED